METDYPTLLKPGFKVREFVRTAFLVRDRAEAGLSEKDIDTYHRLAVKSNFEPAEATARLYLKMDLFAVEAGDPSPGPDPEENDQIPGWPPGEDVVATIHTKMTFFEIDLDRKAETDRYAISRDTLILMLGEITTATRGAFSSSLMGSSYSGMYPPMFNPESLITDIAHSPNHKINLAELEGLEEENH